jgi:hypothetical protein
MNLSTVENVSLGTESQMAAMHLEMLLYAYNNTHMDAQAHANW